ncbi:hypothetical protein SDC9_60467 [bioreactor metagenome]|uniref:Uncharacterized protein n=1 Tax=bioreactor metagenome TaxID=1076179 RepID=A0A644XDY5_9ZZZZ
MDSGGFTQRCGAAFRVKPVEFGQPRLNGGRFRGLGFAHGVEFGENGGEFSLLFLFERLPPFGFEFQSGQFSRLNQQRTLRRGLFVKFEHPVVIARRELFAHALVIGAIGLAVLEPDHGHRAEREQHQRQQETVQAFADVAAAFGGAIFQPPVFDPFTQSRVDRQVGLAQRFVKIFDDGEIAMAVEFGDQLPGPVLEFPADPADFGGLQHITAHFFDLPEFFRRRFKKRMGGGLVPLLKQFRRAVGFECAVGPGQFVETGFRLTAAPAALILEHRRFESAQNFHRHRGQEFGIGQRLIPLFELFESAFGQCRVGVLLHFRDPLLFGMTQIGAPEVVAVARQCGKNPAQQAHFFTGPVLPGDFTPAQNQLIELLPRFRGGLQRLRRGQIGTGRFRIAVKAAEFIEPLFLRQHQLPGAFGQRRLEFAVESGGVEPQAAFDQATALGQTAVQIRTGGGVGFRQLAELRSVAVVAAGEKAPDAVQYFLNPAHD